VPEVFGCVDNGRGTGIELETECILEVGGVV
jgi:hypothetical protein